MAGGSCRRPVAISLPGALCCPGWISSGGSDAEWSHGTTRGQEELLSSVFSLYWSTHCFGLFNGDTSPDAEDIDEKIKLYLMRIIRSLSLTHWQRTLNQCAAFDQRFSLRRHKNTPVSWLDGSYHRMEC